MDNCDGQLRYFLPDHPRCYLMLTWIMILKLKQHQNEPKLKIFLIMKDARSVGERMGTSTRQKRKKELNCNGIFLLLLFEFCCFLSSFVLIFPQCCLSLQNFSISSGFEYIKHYLCRTLAHSRNGSFGPKSSQEYALKQIEGTGISMSACREIAVSCSNGTRLKVNRIWTELQILYYHYSRKYTCL